MCLGQPRFLKVWYVFYMAFLFTNIGRIYHDKRHHEHITMDSDGRLLGTNDAVCIFLIHLLCFTNTLKTYFRFLYHDEHNTTTQHDGGTRMTGPRDINQR